MDKFKMHFEYSNNKNTSMLVYGELFHSVNKLPEFFIPIFTNKLTAVEKMRTESISEPTV